MANLRLAGVVDDSIVDGPGFRFVIFTQGCPHHCPGCHNPETHDFEGGYEKSCEEIMQIIASNPILKGVTFSGGEPFCQAEALCELADMIRAKGLNIMCYTGYTFEQLMAGAQNHPEWLALLERCDVLVDGRYEEDKRSLLLKFRGSSNQRLLDVPASLQQGRAVEAQL